MARSFAAASIVLVMLAGAHAAPARRMLGKSPAPSSDTVGLTLDTGKPLGPGGVGADFGGLSEVPASVGNVDITSLAPFLPLLGKIPPELTAQIALLVPKINVTWVGELLPYLNDVDPKAFGQLIADLAPALGKVDPKVMGQYVEIMAEINPATIKALVPAIAGLNVGVLKRLVPTVNAMSPDVIVNAANLAAALKPETWDALINLVNLGVPAINLAGAKLNMLPIVVDAPPPYQKRSSGWGLPDFFGHIGH